MSVQDLTPKGLILIPSKEKIKLPENTLDIMAGSLGGLEIGSNRLAKGQLVILPHLEQILFGSASSPTSGIGIFIGKDGSDYEWRVGDPSGNHLIYDGTDIAIVGGAITGGTIQTATSGQRIVLTDTDDSLTLYDSSENVLFQLLVGVSVITKINTIAGSIATGLDIDVAGTGKGIDVAITNPANSDNAGHFESNGLGSIVRALALSNANRTKASFELIAVAGQGAHLSLNPIATEPQTPSAGDIYADSDGNLYYYNGSVWVELTSTGLVGKEAGEDLVTGETVYISKTNLTETKEEENTTGSTDASISGTRHGGQTFLIDREASITKVNLMLRKQGTPVGNIQVDIYFADGNHEPTGGSLGTVTMVGTDANASYTLEEFVFSSVIDVDANQEYIMVCKAVNTDQANRIEWQYANSGTPYIFAVFAYSQDSGSTWII